MKSLKSPVVWSTGSSHVIGCENVVFKTKKNNMVLYTFVISGLSPIS